MSGRLVSFVVGGMRTECCRCCQCVYPPTDFTRAFAEIIAGALGVIFGVWGTIDLATDSSASAKTLPGARYLFIIGLFVLGCLVLVQGLQRYWELNAELQNDAASAQAENASGSVLLSGVMADDDLDDDVRYDGQSSDGLELEQLHEHTQAASGSGFHVTFNLPRDDGESKEPAAPASAHSAE